MLSSGHALTSPLGARCAIDDALCPQAVPVSCEQHRMEGMLLVHPPQGPHDAPFLAPPPPAAVADHVGFGGGGLAEGMAGVCESPACSRQAKFGFQVR